MSSPRLSSVPSKDFSSVSKQPVHYVSSGKVSASPGNVPKDQACAVDSMRACISVEGLCSGIKNIGHSSDNHAIVSKCRTSFTSRTTIFGGKGAAASKGHFAISEKSVIREGNQSNDSERKQFPECSMCGDIGLRKQLFRCTKCQYRFQHIYCSNWYPKKRSYAGICNWCDIRDEDRRRKQTKQTENVVSTSQTKFQTLVEEDNSKTKQSKQCNRTQKSDNRSRTRNLWNNELEMLLDAAIVTGEVGLDSKTGNEVTSLTGMRRSRSIPGTDQPSSDGKVVEEMTCLKEPSSLARKIGRRYKFVVDVY